MTDKHGPKSVFFAKLSFTDGWAERPIYNLRGKTTEKPVGIAMVELVKSQFNLSNEEIEKAKKEEIEQVKRDVQEYVPFQSNYGKITRDSKGRIVSPFAARKKLDI